jgi:hypothetical protein
MALTNGSIEQALLQFSRSGADFASAYQADRFDHEMSRLLSIVETANSGEDFTDASGFVDSAGQKIIEKLAELISKLRAALADLVRGITEVVSFSIGLSGPVLSVSVNFSA